MPLITIINGEDKFSWAVDPADQTLAALKTDLIAEKIMQADDVFFRGGAPISNAQLGQIKVSEATVEGTLTIKQQASAPAGRKQISIARGEKKTTFFADLKGTLAALRKELAKEGLMEAEDHFEVNGAEMPEPQETDPKSTVESALKENTLKIKAAVKAGDKTIVIAKGDVKKSFTTNTADTLEQLRKDLTAAKMMSEEDVFLVNGAPVAKGLQETKIKIQDALKEGVLQLKAGSGGVRPGTTPDAPKPAGPPKHDEWTLKPPESGAKDALGLLKDERGAVKTEGLVYYYQLKKAQTATLLHSKLQLNHALAVGAKGYVKAAKEVRKLATEPTYLMPQNILESDHAISFSETLHEIRKRSSKGGKGSVGGFGVSVSAGYTKEKETLHREKETRIYLFASELVPKVNLVIDREDLTATDGFKKAIGTVLAMPDRSGPKPYLALLDVLNEYGFLMPMKFTVGGKIWAETNSWVKEVTDSEREMESFEVGFEASLDAFGYPVKAGGSYSQMDEEKKENSQHQATKSIRKKFIGGDPGLTGKPESWMASLGGPDSWDIIDYDELGSTLDLLPGEMRTACASLIQKNFPHPETFQKTALDMEAYWKQLNAGASDAFT